MLQNFDNVQRINSSNNNVSKFVFTKEDAIAESVLYKYPKYEDRTVICCSTQSGCPVGCRFCLPENEKILTPQGYRNIQDIKINDQVKSYTKEANVLDNIVTQIFENDYNGDLIEINLDNGDVLKLTPNHEVLTANGWITAEKLSENDDIINI